MLKAVLFDLDGTLLPMDQDNFTGLYFKLLAARLAPLGYEPKQLIDGVWSGTKAMIMNDGSKTNEAAFWEKFSDIFGPEALNDKPVFDDYYRVDFQKVSGTCGFNPSAIAAVKYLKERNIRTALATNPVFPAIATESRIRWAGFSPEAFELYTTYENSRHCKPNLEYYRDILNSMKLSPGDCLMVGNDVDEDMIAELLGMEVFLLTDCLINKKSKDISKYHRGSFDDLKAFLEERIS